jgi:LuxR family maltose regulon positive regulatory protein
VSAPILQTKLYIPATTRPPVARPGLTRILEAGSQAGCRLILVSAPAGFGKTTLVADWVRQSSEQTHSRLKDRVAWVTLDSRDNDSSRFIRYILASLQGVDSKLDKFLDQWLSSSNPDLESVFTSLLNQLSEISGHLLIILDDYHLITYSDIHHSVSFFIENLPPQTTLVLVSRTDPPFPLARLRARGFETESKNLIKSTHQDKS